MEAIIISGPVSDQAWLCIIDDDIYGEAQPMGKQIVCSMDEANYLLGRHERKMRQRFSQVTVLSHLPQCNPNCPLLHHLPCHEEGFGVQWLKCQMALNDTRSIFSRLELTSH